MVRADDTGSGAAAFDAWSTRRAISEGYGTEANPLLRPFSHSNAMYAATQVSPLVMDFIGKRMMIEPAQVDEEYVVAAAVGRDELFAVCRRAQRPDGAVIA